MSSETRKEFIVRMMMLINELPEEKKRDHFELLNFLEFQLKARDHLFVEEFITNLTAKINRNQVFYGHAQIKKIVLSVIERFGAESEYNFKVPDYYEKLLQQDLGSETDRATIKKIKQETK